MLNTINTVRRQKLDPLITYRGIVIDNNDPDKKGRVRVKIAGVLDNLESDTHYPWCIPAWSHSDGASDRTGSFDVPKLNAVVGIKFQANPDGSGSIYHPMYGPYHVLDQTVLEDAEHHYPNRKVHFFANGARAVIDTEDDSVWLYNPGETHAKSAGKLCIKSEETFVILSDIEVGIRAPEIAVRAKDHLILESEDKLTMRSKGTMNIESRDDINLLAKRNVNMIAAEEKFKITARSDKGTDGSVEIRSDKHNVLIEASGKGGSQADIKMHAMKNNIEIHARGKKDSKIDIYSKASNIDIIAKGEGADVADININAKKYNLNLHGSLMAKLTSDVIVIISAPTVSISGL